MSEPDHIRGDGARLGGRREARISNSHNASGEAIRIASFGAATLTFAAHSKGLGAGPMIGFDPAGMTRNFDLAIDEIPVMPSRSAMARRKLAA